jgi:hypothetical protein
MIKKMILPFVVCGMMCATGAYAQSGDIIGFYSSSPNSTYAAPSATVEFTIRLAGTIVVSNLFNTIYTQPQIRMEVGSDGSSSLANATLIRSAFTDAPFNPFNRTDLTFAYTVRPGDMADPLKIYGTPSSGFTIYPNQCWIYKAYTGNITSNVVWKVNTGLHNALLDGGLIPLPVDIDLSRQNIKIKTLYFDDANNPNTITARQPATLWRVKSGATNAPAGVEVVVWTPHTNVLQIVGAGPIGSVPGNALLVTIPAGSDYVNFPIKGLDTNAIPTIATVYAQRPSDYAKNVTTGITNVISSSVTILPGSPSISLEFSNGLSSQTLAETHDETTGILESFQIVLSESSTNDIYVALGITQQPGAATNIVMTQPNGYFVRAGDTRSEWYTFSVKDGTRESGRSITPVRIMPVATNKYINVTAGTLIITNAAPTIIGSFPSSGYEYADVTFQWTSLVDVTADLAKGIVFTWDFGDGSTRITETNSAASGQITKTYKNIGSTARPYTVTLTITDADGGSYTLPAHTITINPPIRPPNVSVVVDRTDLTYNEGGSNATYRVVLSEPAQQDTYVQLRSQYPDGTPADACLSLATTNILIRQYFTNSTSFGMTLLDGTAATVSGIDIMPTITNAAAIAQYPKAYPGIVMIQNVAPGIDANPTCLPTTAPVSPYNNIEMGKPFTFKYKATDVTADKTGSPPITVEFQFDDGTKTNVTGITGSVTKTFTNSTGLQIVTMIARDKDGGETQLSFPILVVPPVPPPSVTVVTYPVFIAENDTSLKQLTVMLSQTPASAGLTQPVVVNLTVTPPPGLNPGAITVPASVTFYASESTKQVNFTVQDGGTQQSSSTGFTITPSITTNTPGSIEYIQFQPGQIRVQNVAPVFQQPVDGSTNTVATVGQARAFTWSVSDVPLDLPGMTIFWDWGDGTTSTTTGGSGTTNHTFNAASPQVSVTVTATDKDGGYSRITFYVTVKDSKKVIALPIGQNTAGFNGFTGLGTGTISALVPTTPWILDGVNFIYTFYYGATDTEAQLLATPSPKATGVKQSYFFAWDGPLAAFQNTKHVTQPLAPALTTIMLPTGTAGAAGTAGATTLVGNSVQVSAIFSMEYAMFDGCGDINQDGIPDNRIQTFFIDPATAAANATAMDPIWFTNLRAFNDDVDFLPVYPTGDAQGVMDFRPIPNPNTAVGGVAVNAFTAFMEIRGYDGIIGLIEDLGVPRGNFNDDPGTNPTLQDTDGDTYPDGWEYWFYYQSYKFGRMGSRYDPLNIAQGTRIDWSEITQAFHPNNPRSAYGEVLWRDDFDNDGLLDIEELVLGTDPTNWDTDGDLMADGWEIIRGFNPCDGRDGLLPAQNNPDGDFFAISTAPRQHIQIVTSNRTVTVGGDTVDLIATNHYLAASGVSGILTNTLTTAYRYGNNATGPWAVGRAVDAAVLTPANVITGPANVGIDALILHFQVRDEKGFDPRTAWIGTVGRFEARYTAGGGAPAGWSYGNADRFGIWAGTHAPDTRPFTAVDEYLLMKFMYELQLNGMLGANGWIGRVNAAIANGTTTRLLVQEAWTRFTTHPRTPDTDATQALSDGVPDGWELYMAIPPTPHGVPRTAPDNAFYNSPWDANDYDNDIDVNLQPTGDGVTYQCEFWGTDTLTPYQNANLYYGGMTDNNPMMGVVTIVRPVGHADTYWVNKFWTTDPWNPDTDDDNVGDGGERAFMYGNAAAAGGVCIAGGGLNPNTVDTDRDALPDAWETQFAGNPVAANGTTTLPPVLPGQPALPVTMTINNGQDGTVDDRNKDSDYDGLVSYQEYMTQALRGYRYDVPNGATPNDATVVDPFTGNIGQPMNITFEIGAFFTEVVMPWDQSRIEWPPPPVGGILWWMRPAGPNGYCSTDPQNPDSDFDGMDDYYEMYHGINPLLGNGLRVDFLDDRVAYAWIVGGIPDVTYNANWWVNPATNPDSVGVSMDFVRYPWMNGMPVADPDADGLLNLEEMLAVNTPLPENYNTDPSPLWMTDLSNVNSLTARFYAPYGYAGYKANPPAALYDRAMFFWPPIPIPMFTFQFEMNEGYDTDNDGVSDKDELVANRNTKSDPRDTEDQYRRQALWFSGIESVATAPFLYTEGDTIIGSQFTGMEQAFRSFTVELWARPEWQTAPTGKEQILIERAFDYGQSDASQNPLLPRMRRNFLIGISSDGRLFGGFDNPGGHDEHTDSVRLYGERAQSNKWVHIAIRMDGRINEFSIFVNGVKQANMTTALIPATGIDTERVYPTPDTAGEEPPVIRNGSLTLGGANMEFSALGMGIGNNSLVPPYIMPMDWAAEWDFYDNYYRGWMDEVRVWDGARSDAEIAGTFRKRLTRTELDANRAQIVAQLAEGRGRTANHLLNNLYLSPILLNYYTFNNLFSANADQYVAQVPRGFNTTAVNVNRPDSNDADVIGDAQGATVGWWNALAIKNTVYTNYHYLPWIENVASHLPQMVGVTNTNGVFSVTYGTVIDSIYWTSTQAGNLLVPTNSLNSFPNLNNPYTFTYGTQIPVDLLPLGDAWAKQCTDFWDDMGATAPWLENNTTTDDGLPATWLLQHFGVYDPTAINYTNFWTKTYTGTNELYRALHLTNGQSYQYDLALGWLPSATAFDDYNSAYTSLADDDMDGLPDWWEKIYGLNTLDPLGDNGRDGDPDGDGLTNIYEYWSQTNPNYPDTYHDGISDFDRDYDADGLSNGDEMLSGTHPQLKDTDDDGFADGTEVMYGWNPTSSTSPGQRRVLALGGTANAYVEVPDLSYGIYANRLALEAFTLAADIYPTAVPGVKAELISREVSVGVPNYILNLNADMSVTAAFRPKDYSTLVSVTTDPLSAFAIPLSRWTSVQVVLDPLNYTLKIYINGAEAASVSATLPALTKDQLVNAKTVVGRNFAGYMDNVSISDTTGSRLTYTFNDGTSYNAASSAPAFGSFTPEYAERGQVEDSSAAVNAGAQNWAAANWLNRFNAAGTLFGSATIVYFNEDGITEDQLDSDEDGLPDSWEIANGFDPYNPDSNGNTIADGDEDTDGDGLSNYYEFLAGLNPRKASSDGVHYDIELDSDNDGLMNQLEQANGTMPNYRDTDDDSISDYEEIYGTLTNRLTAVGISDPLSSLSPFIPRGLLLDGNGAVIVTNQARHAMIEWTIAAWVKPSAVTNGTVIARSFNHGVVNYELGVEVDGTTLRPYARYSALGVEGTELKVKVGHENTAPGSIPVHGTTNQVITIPVNVWTHMAAVYAPGDHTLYLYINGDCVAYRTDAIPLPIATDMRYVEQPQLLIGALRLDGTYENGFHGMIDDVRIASYAVDQRGAREMMGEQLVVDTRAVIPTNATTTAQSQIAATRAAPKAIPGEFLVGMKIGINSAALRTKFKNDYQVETVRKLTSANALYVRIPAGINVETAKQKMKTDASVKYVEPNYMVQASQQKIPNDPRFGELWGMNNTGQLNGTADADIDAPEAWAASTGSSNVIVAVIDTGVDYTHPDLLANMWTNPGEIPGNAIDDDGNGIIDDVYGINASFGTVTGDPMDDDSHGTHCAGTIGAAGNNNEGVVGVNWKVKIMALKFIGPFGGSTADAITCIDYAVEKGALLSNNSWGGGGFSQALYDTIARARDKGHLFIAAAGNDSSDNDVVPSYPSNYDLDNIIAVAATDNKDELAWFSNWGLTTVDLAAPGQDILSTIPVSMGSYGLKSGTSMAAPHVTGAAALIMSVNGSLSYSAVANAIFNNGDSIAAADGKTVTGRRLNIGNIIPSIQGNAGIRVRALSGWFRFDDGGTTVEDFTLKADWRKNWRNAGHRVGNAVVTNSAAYLSFGDTDADGLPDWWEESVGLNPIKAMTDDLTPDGERDDDGDGLTNFTEYRASLARLDRGERGLNPNLADTDSDGVTDANEDSDKDGLSNILEQNIYLTDPGNDDTDDDGKKDGAELLARTRPTDSMSPKQELALHFSGGVGSTNKVVVADKVDGNYTLRHSAEQWTIETWVNPVSTNGVLICRKVIELGLRNYELGLTNGVPYVAFDGPGGTTIVCRAGSPIPTNGWTHIAGRFVLGSGVDMNHLSILVNGVSVGEARTGVRSSTGAGDLTLGSDGFAGQLLNTRIWRIARTDLEVFEMMRSELLGGNIGNTAGYLQINGDGFLKETAVTLKLNKDTVDMLVEDWTLECWIRVPANSAAAGRIIARRNQSDRTETDFNYSLELTAEGKIRGRFNVEYGVFVDVGPRIDWIANEDPNINNITGEIPVNDGKWHHVAYKRDATFCYIYIDGLLDTKQERLRIPPLPNIIDDPANYQRVKAGGGPLVMGEGVADWYPSVDEIRIWNRALSLDELKFVSARNLSGSEEGLVSYFNFDFQIGQLANERSKMRNPDQEYGIYIRNAKCLVIANDGPRIAYDPLLTIQGVALIGMFNGSDGGDTVEDRVYRMGFKPFTQEKYAGQKGTGVSFAQRKANYWPAEGLDSDADGLPDDWENMNGLDPFSPDSDGDGVLDAQEDEDGDGLTNYAEWQAGTNPWDQDTDHNGVLDGQEDNDNDGLTNSEELAMGTHPGLADTDDDGVIDSLEGFDASSRGIWAQNSLLPQINRYLSLYGTNYLQVPTGRHLATPTPMMRWTSATNSFTLIMDVNPRKLPSAGETNWLAKCEISPNAYNYAIRLMTNGSVKALITINPNTLEALEITSSAWLPTNVWSTVSLVVNLDELRARLLINGEVFGFGVLPVRESIIKADNNYSLVNVRFGEGYSGKMDNIAFYREALTEDTLRYIRDTVNNKLGILGYETPNLYGCYLFDDGTSATNGVGQIIQDNVSKKAGGAVGQVQDFACLFWDVERQGFANFTLKDWTTGWRNAGTVMGTGASFIVPYEGEDLASKDSNGDGLPDAWSQANGIDPYGPSAAMDDPDNDGLSNYAEYLISERYHFDTLDPRAARSKTGLLDYFIKPIGFKLTYGFMFTDHDFIEDWWEKLYFPITNPYVYDPKQDDDSDGWSNWAEARYSQAIAPVRPDRREQNLANGRTVTEYPVPIVDTRLSYKGIQTVGNVVIQAYANPAMNGPADATWTLASGGAVQAETLQLGFYEARSVCTYLSPGSVVPKTFQIRFTDTWTGLNANNGYDSNGVIYAKSPTNTIPDIKMGTIDYVTGKIVMNMGVYTNSHLIIDAATYPDNRDSYVDVETSYVDINYSTKLLTGWPQHVYLGRPDQGMLREGTNYFLAFLDVGGNVGTWDPGEPAGIATPFGTTIGWDNNSLNIQLTDYTPSYLRLSLTTGLRSEDVILGTGGNQGAGGQQVAATGFNRVRIVRAAVQNSGFTAQAIFDKTIYGRNYIHEGDLMTLPIYAGHGLDWGLPGVLNPANVISITYKVYVGDQDPITITNNTLVATFTNKFDVARSVPTSVLPSHGTYVYTARPTFTWAVTSSNGGYNAFAFEMRKGSSSTTSTNNLVYPVTVREMPLRDTQTGNYVWEAPFYMGDKNVVNNGVYYWRVQLLNSKYSTTNAVDSEWSSWKIFRWDVNQPLPPAGTATNVNGSSSGYGQLRAVVKYFGAITNNVADRTILQAFDNRGFTGFPAAQYTFASNEFGVLTNASLSAVKEIPMRGLKPGTYYVRAFIDSNNNGVLDTWESWGYANYYGEKKSLYDVRPVDVLFSAISPLVTVYIEDADTDQDWFPDAYEYQANSNLTTFGPGSTNETWNAGDTEINPNLNTNVISYSFIMSDPSRGSQSAFFKMAVDPASVTPEIPPAVTIQNLSFSEVTPKLDFDVTAGKPAQSTSAVVNFLLGASRTLSAPAVRTYTYRVRFSESLAAPRPWPTIVKEEKITVDANGTKTIMSEIDSMPAVGTRGFFYVEVE